MARQKFSSKFFNKDPEPGAGYIRAVGDKTQKSRIQ